jgi:hypothetical protein
MSDQDTSFFGTEADHASTAVKEPPVITLPDEAKELVGEGKKYKTIEEALKGLVHGQAHIARLEEENAKFRETETNAKTVEEMVVELRKLYEKLPPQAAEQSTDIQQTVLDVLNKVEDQKTKKNNLSTVHKEMTKIFGDKADEVVRKKAEELGYPLSELKREAMVSPKAFLERFQIKSSDTDVHRSSSSVSTEALGAAKIGVKEGTKAWYDQLRKQNPTKYYSPEITAKMMDDRKRLGEDFYK